MKVRLNFWAKDSTNATCAIQIRDATTGEPYQLEDDPNAMNHNPLSDDELWNKCKSVGPITSADLGLSKPCTSSTEFVREV